jgi:hypothetical protein
MLSSEINAIEGNAVNDLYDDIHSNYFMIDLSFRHFKKMTRKPD